MQQKTLYSTSQQARLGVQSHGHLDGLEAQMAELMHGEGNTIDLALQEMNGASAVIPVLFDLKKYSQGV